VQTRDAVARLNSAAGLAGLDVSFKEQIIRTTGDAVTERRLADIGGKGLFAKEIHESLRDGHIDLAVHSLKDLETALPEGIVLGAVLPREDPRDALILGPACTAASQDDPYAAIPASGLIGTSSVRRQAQLLHTRPDLRVTLLRGNVQTRLSRVRTGEMAASLLALAGLRRLGLAGEASIVLDPSVMLPAACQGIVGLTVRGDDRQAQALLALIDDRQTRVAALAERALLGALDGSCRTPIAAHAVLGADGTVTLEGLIARTDGTFLLRRRQTGAQSDATALGTDLGHRLRAGSPADIFA
jgi:hydroxymethylbilane synthase